MAEGMAAPLRAALVGAGQMGSDLARKAERLGRARIAAVCDPAPGSSAAEFDAPIVGRIEEIAVDEIDVFIVAPPPLAHLETVLKLAPLGKPIFCEKPLTTTAAGCDAMVRACRQSGVKLFVGQVLRLFPLFRKSSEIVASGQLGRPRVCAITRAGGGDAFRAGWRTRFADSGGLLQEVNSHELDYMVSLFGPGKSVFAQGVCLNRWGDFDDVLTVQIQFAGGGVGLLHSSIAAPAGEYRIHIQCERGTILHGGFSGNLTYRALDEPHATVLSKEDLGEWPDPYEAELTAFFDWVELGGEPLLPGELGSLNVAIAEAAYRSVKSGRVEPVEPTLR